MSLIILIIIYVFVGMVGFQFKDVRAGLLDGLSISLSLILKPYLYATNPVVQKRIDRRWESIPSWRFVEIYMSPILGVIFLCVVIVTALAFAVIASAIIYGIFALIVWLVSSEM